MKCKKCDNDKLSKEFPNFDLSENCEHGSCYCIRCTINYLKTSTKCPRDDCNEIIEREIIVQKLNEQINELYPRFEQIQIEKPEHKSGTVRVTFPNGKFELIDYTSETTVREIKKILDERSNVISENHNLHWDDIEVKDTIYGREAKLIDYKPKEFNNQENDLFPLIINSKKGNEISSRQITVATLNGESEILRYTCKTTILEIKKELEIIFNVPSTKQELICDKVEIKDIMYGKEAKLIDYNLKDLSIVQMLVLLYDIPAHLNHVIFDLTWGYPKWFFGWLSTTDVLDGTCLMFDNKKLVKIVDHESSKVTYMSHSGDMMDSYNKTGHHKIEAKLFDIPTDITHLFFVLSSRKSSTISDFTNPNLKFFAADNKTINLCETKIDEATKSQKAVIICSVKRTPEGWKIYEHWSPSSGNSMNYNPIITNIQRMI